MQITSTLPSGNQAAIVRTEYFIEGTEPQAQTPHQGGGGILSRLFHSGNDNTAPPVATTAPTGNENAPVVAPPILMPLSNPTRRKAEC